MRSPAENLWELGIWKMIKGKKYRKSFRSGGESRSGFFLKFEKEGGAFKDFQLPPHFDSFAEKKGYFS